MARCVSSGAWVPSQTSTPSRPTRAVAFSGSIGVWARKGNSNSRSSVLAASARAWAVGAAASGVWPGRCRRWPAPAWAASRSAVVKTLPAGAAPAVQSICRA